MRVATMPPRMLLDDLERHHADKISCLQLTSTASVLLLTLLVTTARAPVAFVTFFVIPMMGQVAVGLSVALILAYLVARKSLLVASAVVIGAVIFGSALFASIQVIKGNLEVPLFFFTAMGIPVCAICCIFIASKVWTIRGGIDPL